MNNTTEKPTYEFTNCNFEICETDKGISLSIKPAATGSLTKDEMSAFSAEYLKNHNSKKPGIVHLTVLPGVKVEGKEATDIFNSFEYYCLKNIKEIHLENLDVSQATSFSAMFKWEQELETVVLPEGKAKNVKTINEMFAHCLSLKEIKNLNCLSESKLLNMDRAFCFCMNLQRIDVGSLHPDNNAVLSFNEVFKNANSLKEIYLNGFLPETSISHATEVFAGCTSLKRVVFPAENRIFFGSPNEESEKIFFGCISLEEVDFGAVVFWCAKNYSHMFSECSSLKRIISRTLMFPEDHRILSGMIDDTCMKDLREISLANMSISFNKKSEY